LTPTTPSSQYPPQRGTGRAGVDSHHSLLPVPSPEGEGEGGSSLPPLPPPSTLPGGGGGGREFTPTTPSSQYPPRRGRGRAGVHSHHSLLPVPSLEGEGEGGSSLPPLPSKDNLFIYSSIQITRNIFSNNLDV